MLRIVPRATPRIVGLAFGLLLAWQATIAVSNLVDQATSSSLPGAASLAYLAFVLGVGRLVLSLLPPGAAGSHDLAALPTTWAASHLCGLAALCLHGALLAAIGSPSVWTLVVPWLALAALRFATLPGAMVPRHGVLEERPEGRDRIVGRAALGATAACGAALLLLDPAARGAAAPGVAEALGRAVARLGAPPESALPLLVPCTWFALWVLLDDGLRVARRAPSARRLVVLFTALVTLQLPTSILSIAFLGAGASFLIGWLRRADRRAACLSAASFAACAASGQTLLGVAGALTLVVTGKRPQRAWAAGAAAAALLLVAWPAHELFARGAQTAPVGSAPGSVWLVVWLALLAALVTTRIAWERRARTADVAHEPDSVSSPFDEVRGLLSLLLLGTLACGPWSGAWGWGALPAHLFPVAVLLGGLVGARAERPDGRPSPPPNPRL